MLITQGTPSIKLDGKLPALGANNGVTGKVISDEQAGKKQSSIVFEQRQTPAKSYNVKEQQEPVESSSFSEKLTLQTVMQKILDQRLGIDRERLDEIEEEIKTIMNDPNLSDEEKKLMVDALNDEKKAIMEKQAKEFATREKNAAGQQQITQPMSQPMTEEVIPQKRQGDLSQDQSRQPLFAQQTKPKQPTQEQSEHFLAALITDKYHGQKANHL
jgi:hypothetical protein